MLTRESRRETRDLGSAIVQTTGLAALFFAITLLLQWAGGAYQAEFGSYPDEAAHYVTGLMIHDYLVGGIPGNPMRFAEQYYDHYPKVALGNWPPVYYLIQSAWMLVFSPGRASVLVLMALLTAFVATVVARALWPRAGPAAAIGGGLLVLAFPQVQQYSMMMMTEIPVALFSILAALSFGRYLERERTIDSLAFGVFASAAIMTKGSGFVLALVPPLAIVLSGRWEVVRRLNFWYPALIVAVLAGPWTWAFRDVARAGWQESAITLDYTIRAASRFPLALIRASSYIITALALGGLVIAVVGVRRRRLDVAWVTPAALVIAVLLFHMVVPASLDVRHIIQALPAWAMLVVLAVVTITRAVAARDRRVAWLVTATAVMGLGLTAWPIQAKGGAGYGRIVEELVKAPEQANAIFLISSDAIGEGMFISETAMREGRPGHKIRRASKLLADQRWHGGDYRLKVGGAADVTALLRKQKIRFVVIDHTVPPMMLVPHHGVLTGTVENNPADFRLRATYAITRGYPRGLRNRRYPQGVTVYEVLPAAPQ